MWGSVNIQTEHTNFMITLDSSWILFQQQKWTTCATPNKTSVNEQCIPHKFSFLWALNGDLWQTQMCKNENMLTTWHSTMLMTWHFTIWGLQVFMFSSTNFEFWKVWWKLITCTPLSHVSENLLKIVYFQTGWYLPSCRPPFQEFNGKDNTPIQCPTLKIWIFKENSQLIPKWNLKLIKFNLFFV